MVWIIINISCSKVEFFFFIKNTFFFYLHKNVTLSCTLHDDWIIIKGGSRIFKSGRGGATFYILCVDITSTKQTHTAWVCTGSTRVFDALSCYQRLILKNSDTKRDFRKHGRLKFVGGGGAHMPVAPPLGSATDHEVLIQTQCNTFNLVYSNWVSRASVNGWMALNTSTWHCSWIYTPRGLHRTIKVDVGCLKILWQSYVYTHMNER